MHVDKTDVAKMQEEFARNVSEFASRFLSAWSDAAKRMGIHPATEGSQRFGTGWVDLEPFAKMVGSQSAAQKIQEAMKLASEDLSVVVASLGDPEKIERIRSKWTKFCEQSVRDMLGIPGPPDAAKLLDQWRGALDYLSPTQGSPLSGSFPGFFGLTSPSGWPLPGVEDGRREMFRAWAETYGKTFGGIFPVPARGRGDDHEDRTRQAISAQIRFLQCLPEFQEHIVAASKGAVTKVLENLHKLGLKEMNAESHKLFCASWVSANEKMFQELFGSDSFLKTLTKAVQQGKDAKEKMESIMADWTSAGNEPNPKDVEDLRHSVYTVEKRVRLLERELEDLKRVLARTIPQDADRTGHKE
jgi:hypothetical protein